MSSESPEPQLLQCEGWWEQNHMGRHHMEELQLSFSVGSIRGSGHDIVGIFTFSGTMESDGSVVMVKQYLGAHTVDYFGRYDGEGVMAGEWDMVWDRGPWMIRIKRLKVEESAEIQELVPEPL